MSRESRINHVKQLREIASKSTECNDKLGLHEGAHHDQVHQDLHKIVVSEWMENSQRDQPFLTNLTVDEVAPVFLQPGKFNHDLGNTMPCNGQHHWYFNYHIIIPSLFGEPWHISC